MFERTCKIYEVFTYKNEGDGEPFTRTTSTRKTDALKVARHYAPQYWRVEVNALYYNADDENDIFGADLVAAWENGKKTTK